MRKFFLVSTLALLDLIWFDISALNLNASHKTHSDVINSAANLNAFSLDLLALCSNLIRWSKIVQPITNLFVSSSCAVYYCSELINGPCCTAQKRERFRSAFVFFADWGFSYATETAAPISCAKFSCTDWEKGHKMQAFGHGQQSREW